MPLFKAVRFKTTRFAEGLRTVTDVPGRLTLSLEVAGVALDGTTDIGDVVTVTALTKNSAGTLTNPTAITFYVKDPLGEIADYIYGTDNEVARPSTGTFTFDYTPTLRGTYTVRVVATGTVKAAERDTFEVRSQY